MCNPRLPQALRASWCFPAGTCSDRTHRPSSCIDIQRDRLAVFDVQEFIRRPGIQGLIGIQAIGTLNVCDGFIKVSKSPRVESPLLP